MRFLLLLIFLTPTILVSQVNIEKVLDRVSTKTQAEVFLKRYKSKVTGEIITVTDSNSEFFKLKKGEQIKKDGSIYKVIGKGKSSSYNISIMLFDSNKTTITEINSLRSFILKGIKNGEHKFENLARVYSAHPSAKTGGGLGWINKGTFSDRFEKIIATKRKGQVFSYDEHREKKHYIVKKNEANKDVVSIIILKVNLPK